jgi:hypothetical protein
MKNYWRIQPIKPIRIKPIRIHFRFDTDHDGVIDHKDCRPFNRYKQDEVENKYRRERYQRPDVKQYHKDYAQRPEVKAKRKLHSDEYRKRPEVKQLRREQVKEHLYQQKEKMFGELEGNIENVEDQDESEEFDEDY